MPGKNNSGISHRFCQEAQKVGGLLSLAHLRGALEKGKCRGCPEKGTVSCRERVQESLQDILSPEKVVQAN